MTRTEARTLYNKFQNTGREAFTLHEIWLAIFYDGAKPRVFEPDVQETDIANGQVYICDPAKNTSCTSVKSRLDDGCLTFHICQCTTNKEFAKTDENNKPIVADMMEE